MTRIGTAYFVSKASAILYYSDYELTAIDAIDTVNRKLAEGSIHIGKPPARPGDRVVIIDNGTRYAIEEGTP